MRLHSMSFNGWKLAGFVPVDFSNPWKKPACSASIRMEGRTPCDRAERPPPLQCLVEANAPFLKPVPSMGTARNTFKFLPELSGRQSGFFSEIQVEMLGCSESGGFGNPFQPISIRIHRALSWLEVAERLIRVDEVPS